MQVDMKRVHADMIVHYVLDNIFIIIFSYIKFSANFPEKVVESYNESVQTGIYFGWAQVDTGAVHKMVMSVGWNPYYKNEKKSMVRSLVISLLNYQFTLLIAIIISIFHCVC